MWMSQWSEPTFDIRFFLQFHRVRNQWFCVGHFITLYLFLKCRGREQSVCEHLQRFSERPGQVPVSDHQFTWIGLPGLRAHIWRYTYWFNLINNLENHCVSTPIYKSCIFFYICSAQWDCHPSISKDHLMWVLEKGFFLYTFGYLCGLWWTTADMFVFCISCPCGGWEWRGGYPVLQADFQRGFPIWPVFWREPACQHHHWKGSLWGGDAPPGFPDQDAGGADTPLTTRTLLCAQSTQLHQLRDQEQRRARSEELHLGCRGREWNKVHIL